jgi:hypothetical protein
MLQIHPNPQEPWLSFERGGFLQPEVESDGSQFVIYIAKVVLPVFWHVGLSLQCYKDAPSKSGLRRLQMGGTASSSGFIDSVNFKKHAQGPPSYSRAGLPIHAKIGREWGPDKRAFA